MGANFSYSRVDCFNQCGFKYYLQYEAGFYCFSESVATEFGTLIHSTEEAIAKAIQAGQPIDYITLKNKIIRAGYELGYKYQKAYNEPDSKSGRTYPTKIYEYLDSGIYRLEKFMKAHPTYKIVGIEQSFQITFEGKPFKGFIDRVFQDTATGKYIIQDIKTYAKELEDKELATPLQFVVYVLAGQKLYGVDETQFSCQYDLPLCGTTQDAGSKGFMSRGTKKLTELLHAIDNKQFDPKPSPLCNWCQFCQTSTVDAEDKFKLLCPYFCHWTRESKVFTKENEWQGMQNHDAVMKKYLEKCATFKIHN